MPFPININIYTGCCVWFAPLCYSYMGRSHEKNKDKFLNYIQYYMKKSIYFNGIGFNLLSRVNLQKIVLYSKIAFLTTF